MAFRASSTSSSIVILESPEFKTAFTPHLVDCTEEALSKFIDTSTHQIRRMSVADVASKLRDSNPQVLCLAGGQAAAQQTVFCINKGFREAVIKETTTNPKFGLQGTCAGAYNLVESPTFAVYDPKPPHSFKCNSDMLARYTLKTASFVIGKGPIYKDWNPQDPYNTRKMIKIYDHSSAPPIEFESCYIGGPSFAFDTQKSLSLWHIDPGKYKTLATAKDADDCSVDIAISYQKPHRSSSHTTTTVAFAIHPEMPEKYDDRGQEANIDFMRRTFSECLGCSTIERASQPSEGGGPA